MSELTQLRTENGKMFDAGRDAKSGRPSYTLEARTGPIHYKEAYKDTDPWLDLDESYSESGEIKGIGKVLVYPKLPNIVTVYQDICGYQIQSRSNPDHIAKVELVSIDGQEVSAWQDSAALKTSVRVHPYRVGIWKDFSAARTAKASTMRWRVTELGNSGKDSHPFAFRETPEAFNTADLDSLIDRESAKVAIETARTRIDDQSWHWDELIPANAKLVDTDWQIVADADDGEWGTSGFNAGTINSHWLGSSAWGTHQAFNRFADVDIPKMSTITAAKISYRAYANRSNAVSLYVCAHDDDDPTTPSSSADLNNRAKTTATVSYSPGNWSGGSWYDTPESKSVLQELVDRPGFASDHVLMLVMYTSGSSVREWTDYYNNSSYAPKLSITWTEPTRRGPHIYVPNVSWLSKSLLKRREI